LNRNYWQQSAGDTDRNYAEVCLRWGVILNGPGYAGAWPECAKKLRHDKWSSKKVTDLKRFSETMSDGDIVVLRLGTSKILGVGIVVGNYEWLDIFGDVDGWDLQHVRRVNWLWEGLDTPKRFKTYTLKQGDTTQKLDSKVIQDWIISLDLNYESLSVLEKLPHSENNTTDFESISEFLFDNGISSTSIDILNKEIDELVRIAKWYNKYDNPSEFETVAYLAVPLLRALGWTPQKMAIEWNKVDVALFNSLPRKDANLDVVVEAKKKGNSCLSAFSQAQSYAVGKENCRRLIVTDGLRYGVYIKQEHEFKLYAYFNITDLKLNYPIYECFGVNEALRAMTPEWSHSITNHCSAQVAECDVMP
jgi:hypothetical protein